MNEYRDVHTSLLHFVASNCRELQTQGFDLTALNLDAFANPTDWPAGDFLALSEFMMDTDGKTIEGASAIVVSTKDDMNLRRMAKLVNILLDQLLPGKSIPVLDSVSGALRGRIYMVGSTRVSSVVNTETQPAQPIFIRFRSDQTFR